VHSQWLAAVGGVRIELTCFPSGFFINLPIGAIAFVVIMFFFPDPKRDLDRNESWSQRVWHFDPIGTALFMPAIICLLLALQWGGTTYEWKSWRIILLFVLSGVLLLAFLFVQWWAQEDATVPPRIFFKRTVWSSGFYSFAIGSAFLGAVYYLPIWFQAVKGASAVNSGIMNLPMLISCVLMSLVAGIVITAVGYYTPFMILGAILISIGFGLLTTFQPDTPQPKWIGYQILAGAGVGFGMQQPMMAVQVVLDIADVPTGVAAIVFLQTLGGALFVSVGQNVFTNKLVELIPQYAPGVDPAYILSLGATSIQSTVSAIDLPGVTQAYNDALTHTFTAFTGIACVSVIGSLIVEWKSVKGKNIEMGGA
jgi:hypothetical protein